MKWTLILQRGGRGWTESYFRSSDTGNLYDEIDPMLVYAQARAGLLGKGAFVKGLRPSIEFDPAGVAVVGDAVSNLVSVFGNGQEPIENEDDALLVTWSSANGTRRKNQYLRGIWQSITNADGNFTPTANFITAFTQWYNAVITAKIGWITRTPVLPKATISNYTQTTDFRVTFTCTSDVFTDAQVSAGLPVAVNVRGLNTKSKLNGTQLVIPSTKRVSTTVKPIAVFPFLSPGFMNRFATALILPNVPTGSTKQAIAAKRIVERRPGAPLFESRGRRSAVPKG